MINRFRYLVQIFSFLVHMMVCSAYCGSVGQCHYLDIRIRPSWTTVETSVPSRS